MKITRFEDLKVLAQWDFPMMIRQDDKSYPLSGVISSFENLRLSHRVKQLSHKLALEVSELVNTFPKNEKYDLVSQMRRSARSISSDISEGFGRFHFNDKLTFYERARASLGELRNHFMEASGNRYIDEVTYDRYRIKMSEIGFLLNRVIRNVRISRDNHKVVKKAKPGSSRRLTSNATRPVECETSPWGALNSSVAHFQSRGLNLNETKQTR